MSITKIAERAGVSIATVSRVINNSRPVNPEIAAAVRKAMEELNITPRKRIRKSQKQTTIAIVALGHSYRGWFDSGIIATVVGEITRVAQEHDLAVLLAEMPSIDEVPSALRRGDIAGALVFIAGHRSAVDASALQREMPLIRVLGGELGPMELDQVGVDNSAIGYLAAKYLIDNGIKDFAFLTLHPDWAISQLRAQGFLAGANMVNGHVRSYLANPETRARGFFGTDVVTEATPELLIQRLKENHKGRTGLFVARDEETVLVYRLLRDAGLRPHDDVLVISCDNEAARLQSLHPRPASINLSPADIAHRAVLRLISRIKHRTEPPVRILVSPSLSLPPAADHIRA